MANPTAGEAARRLLVLCGITTFAHAIPPLQQFSYKEWFAKRSKEEQDKVFQSYKKIPKSFADFFRSAGIWNDLSPIESKFLHTYPQDLRPQDQVNHCWRWEGAVALMWAFGIFQELPPFDRETDFSLVNRVPKKDARQFVETARLRPQQELEAGRSLAQSWHWRSRTRQLIEEGRPFYRSPQTPQFGNYDDTVRFTAKALKGEGALTEIINEDFPATGKAYRELTKEEWILVRSITMERHFALNWLCGYAPGNRWDETPMET